MMISKQILVSVGLFVGMAVGSGAAFGAASATFNPDNDCEIENESGGNNPVAWQAYGTNVTMHDDCTGNCANTASSETTSATAAPNIFTQGSTGTANDADSTGWVVSAPSLPYRIDCNSHPKLFLTATFASAVEINQTVAATLTCVLEDVTASTATGDVPAYGVSTLFWNQSSSEFELTSAAGTEYVTGQSTTNYLGITGQTQYKKDFLEGTNSELNKKFINAACALNMGDEISGASGESESAGAVYTMSITAGVNFVGQDYDAS
jgi:hypothetical protein